MRKPSVMKFLWGLAAMLALGFSVGVFAQSNTTGSIFGQAKPESEIVAVNQQTGFSRSTSAADDGSFRLSALPPGRYVVTETSSDGSEATREVRPRF